MKWICVDYHAGCQEQGYWEHIDNFWWSSLPDGLYEASGGTTKIISHIRLHHVLYVVDEDCARKNILGLISHHVSCTTKIISKTNTNWRGLCLQKHIGTNADITVSCVPMDERYIYLYAKEKIVYALPLSKSFKLSTN